MILKVLIALSLLQLKCFIVRSETEYNYEEASGEKNLSAANIEENLRLHDEKFKMIEEKIDEILSALLQEKNQIYRSNTGTKIESNDAKQCDRKLEPYLISDIQCPDKPQPNSCDQVNECHKHLYNIKVPNYSDQPFPVVCDLKTDDGGWTIIQRRLDGSVDFYRNWTDYVEGFGNLNGEFFIGLEKLHILTTQGKAQELYIDLEDFEGVKRHARYKTFKVDSRDTDYKLTVADYSGYSMDSFTYHSGQNFSTFDRNNYSCSKAYKGGWWYKSCHESNLNGLYLPGKISKKQKGMGIVWQTFRASDYSLKTVQMMVRPKDD